MRQEKKVAFRLSLLATVLSVAVVVGCGHETDDPVTLQPPFVEITGGPLDGSEDSYTARIFWSGWDEDGVITHYQYALDPPIEFTNEEIEYPESSPGLTMTIIPGPAEFQDTLVVSKTVAGERYEFRWVQTREFSRSFAFETPLADSVNVNGRIVPTDPGTFSGAHRVYVRAQDNDDLFSEARTIGYTAKTFTPEATIARPVISSEILNLGATVTVGWEGLDPDSPDAAKRPTGYIYQLLRLDTLDPPQPILDATPQTLYNRGNPNGWIYQPADTLETVLRLAVGGRYIFGVRAVDVAGSIEPFMEQGRNFFKFQAFANGGFPELCIAEPALGEFCFTAVGAPVEVQVPTGKALRFQWEASGELYGGEIESYSWGVDIPDLDREGPDSGWSPWGDIKLSTPITFNRPGIHVLYVRARDISGSISVGTIVMDVLEFTFNRDVLLVDDSFDGQFPSDDQQDTFWRQRFANYGTSPLFEFSAHGINDRGALSPLTPTLEELGKHRLVVWDNNGGGYNAESSLLKVATLTPLLGSFLGAGGKMWVSGRMTIPPMLQSENQLQAQLVYPIDDQRMVPGTFAWDFMKLQTTRVNNPKGSGEVNFLYGVAPYPGQPAIYDSMTINQSKVRFPFQKAVTHCDAIFDPIFAEQDPTFKGDIDSLYLYQAYGPVVVGVGSSYHNRLNAIRWHDPDPDFLHGRVQWFGFSFYFMRDSDADNTFTKSMDWFKEGP